jgi:glycosyltransferase involved in cell wall biosynthesis
MSGAPARDPHVLLLSPFFSPNRGGVETHLEGLTGLIAERGWKATLLTFQPLATTLRARRRERRGTVEIVRLPRPLGGRALWTEQRAFVQSAYLVPYYTLATILWMALRGRRVTVLHAHGFMAAAVAYLATRVFRRPYLVSTHTRLENYVGGGRSGLAVGTMIGLLRAAHRVLVNTNDMKQELVDLGVPAERIVTHVQWNESIFLRDADDPKPYPDGRLRVVFVGRLIREKGAQCLVEAAARLPQIDVVIVGGGPMLEELRERATGNVDLRGPLPPDATPALYRDAHVAVVASLYPDAYPRVVTEAIGCGTPVAGIRRGGVPEAMDETVGWFLDGTDERALADELTALLERLDRDRDEVAGKAAACVPYAERLYSPRNAERIFSAYVTPTGSAPASGGSPA